MVLIERPAADAPAPTTRPGSTTRSRSSRSGSSEAFPPAKPRDSAYDQVAHLFPEHDDEQPPESLTTAAIPNPPTGGAVPVESFDDAMAAAGRFDGEPPLESPAASAEWTASAIHRWRPWLMAAGAGLLGMIGAIGMIRLLVGATIAADLPNGTIATAESAETTESTLAEENAEPPSNDPSKSLATITAPPGRAPAAPSLASEAETDAPPNIAVEAEMNRPLADAGPKPRDQFGELTDVDSQSLPNAPLEEPEVAIVDPPEGNSIASFGIAVVSKVPPEPMDIAERLGNRISSIQLQRIPLHRFFDFISDYSAIPITMRWDSIMLAGTTVGRTVDVDAQASSIDDVLQHVLTPLRLTAKRNGQHIEVKRRSAATWTTRYLVADLVNPNSPLEYLARLVQQLVAPGTWKQQGGEGQLAINDGRLAINQAESAHFETIMLLEQLRVARGQRPLSSYPRDMFRLSDRPALLREVLTRSVRVPVQDHVRFAEVLRQLGEAAGCVILPDWPAIAEAGWTMDTELEVTLSEMSFDNILRQLCAVLGLTYRVLDGRTLEMTSPAAEQQQAEFSLYDLRPLRKAGFDVTRIGERIQQAIGVDQFRVVGGAIAIDAASDHVIVRLPQSLQIVVRDLLTTWGA